jgi:hypothetical protein
MSTTNIEDIRALPPGDHGGQTGAYPTLRTERGVTWGAPRILPGINALSKRNDATLDALTCPTPGNCVAAGSAPTGLSR